MWDKEKILRFIQEHKKVWYQTFQFPYGILARGDSDSIKKWDLMKPHLQLKNKSVLDIGCNLGFFSFEAKKAGSSRVVGIDKSAEVIKIAKEIRDNIFKLDVDFRVVDFATMPHEEFDYVFLLATLHYTPLIETIKKVSTFTKEAFILECVVSKEIEKYKLLLEYRPLRKDIIPNVATIMYILWEYFREAEIIGPSVSPNGSMRILIKCLK